MSLQKIAKVLQFRQGDEISPKLFTLLLFTQWRIGYFVPSNFMAYSFGQRLEKIGLLFTPTSGLTAGHTAVHLHLLKCKTEYF